MTEKLNRIQTEAQINVRAWKDPAFKAKLTTDPQEALKEAGMTKIPKALNVQVIEEEKDNWVILLHKRPINYKELSEEVLEKIAVGELQEAKCCPKKPT